MPQEDLEATAPREGEPVFRLAGWRGTLGHVCAAGPAIILGCAFVAISSPYWIIDLFVPHYPSAQSLPAYPNGGQIERRRLTAEEGKEFGDKVVTGEVLTFETRDSLGIVLSFYRKLLLREGWVVRNYSVTIAKC
jgi:hypothetical protein